MNKYVFIIYIYKINLGKVPGLALPSYGAIFTNLHSAAVDFCLVPGGRLYIKKSWKAYGYIAKVSRKGIQVDFRPVFLIITK